MNLYDPAFDPQYTPLHKFHMKHDVPKLLRAIQQRTGEKQQSKLARRLGRDVAQPQISRWLRGTEPEVENYERIVGLAHAVGVLSDLRSEDVAEAMGEPPRPKAVKLKGYVGAGSQAHFYALADEDYEEVPAPPGVTDQTVAVEIKGKSMGEALESWLVYYDDVRSPVSDAQIGRLCVVGLADDRILVKVLMRSPDGRGFRLKSNNSEEPVIEHAQVEWAALVTNLGRR